MNLETLALIMGKTVIVCGAFIGIAIFITLVANYVAKQLIGLDDLLTCVRIAKRNGLLYRQKRKPFQCAATAHPVEHCECETCADARERIYGSRAIIPRV